MTALVRCARALVQGREVSDFAFAAEQDRIAAIDSFDRLRERYPGAATQEHGSDVIAVPGFVNGHSHAYQVLLRGWADDLPFSRWRADALYRIVPQLTPEEIYDTFAFAFREMLAGGITTVAEFFYLNGGGNAHAEAAISAAAAAGIRLIFARTWMDAHYAPPAFRETSEVAAKRTAELMDRYPHANICVAPHSLHAASSGMIAAASRFAAERGCMLHVHVAEARYEEEECLQRYGATPVAALARFGSLGERTVLVHAIYVGGDDRRAIANAGGRVVHNPMTNQYLGDGICDVVSYRALGVPVALGTDADVKPSIFDEMRAASMLQKIARCDGAALDAPSAYAMGTSLGAAALGIDAGDFLVGAYADYALIETTGIDPWSPALNALVYRAENGWVRETYVSGRRVYRRGAAPQGLAERLQNMLGRLHLPQGE